MYVVLYILAFVALVGFGGWFASNLDWEPGIGIVTSFAGLIALYLNDDNQKTKSKAYWEKRKDDVVRGLARIKREAGNLQHIAEGRGFKSEARRKAVEDSSLELLDRDLSPLASYWRYGTLVRQVLAELKKVKAASPKSVVRLRPLVESLEARLRSDRTQAFQSA